MMESRSWIRQAIGKEIVCSLDGQPHRVHLFDLSVGGCMIGFSHEGPEVGSQVQVDLGGFATVDGLIAWRGEDAVGVRFEVPIHEAIVRHLGFTPDRAAFERTMPRDRFGRALPPLGSSRRSPPSS